MNSLVRPNKAAAFSTQENTDTDRNTHAHRKPSVLDEKVLREDDSKLVRDQRIQTMTRSYQVILESIGEDPLRQGKISLLKLIKIIFLISQDFSKRQNVLLKYVYVSVSNDFVSTSVTFYYRKISLTRNINYR
jgi:hypothetical protein